MSAAKAAVAPAAPAPVSSTVAEAAPAAAPPPHQSTADFVLAMGRMGPLFAMFALLCYVMVKVAKRREGGCLDEEETLIPKQKLALHMAAAAGGDHALIGRDHDVEETPMTMEVTDKLA